MKKIGLIGTGRHGSRYARHIVNDIENLELSAISRRSEVGRQQAVEWRACWYPEWIDLVYAGDVDAVITVAPPNVNLQVAKACARAGKPLLIEKPLARNVTEACEIAAIMKQAGCAVTVGQTLRYNPVVQDLAVLLPDMGKLHSFYANQRIEPSTLAWHDEPDVAGAGVVMHTAVHVFDALRSITGLRVIRVMATSKCTHSHVLEDLMVILAELENGAVGMVEVSKVGQARSGRIEFVCDDGHLCADHIHGYSEIVRKNKVDFRKEYVSAWTVALLLQEWAEFLEGKKENPISVDDGLYAVAVCAACLESARLGCWVEL